MIGVRVKSEGTRKALAELRAGLEEAVLEGLADVAAEGEAVAKEKAPGRLGESIHVLTSIPPIRLVATARHARHVEYGRGAVRARRARALRFEINGKVLFRVRVGPARARPFMRPAGVAMAKSRAVHRAVERLIRSV